MIKLQFPRLLLRRKRSHAELERHHLEVSVIGGIITIDYAVAAVAMPEVFEKITTEWLYVKPSTLIIASLVATGVEVTAYFRARRARMLAIAALSGEQMPERRALRSLPLYLRRFMK